MRYEVDRRDGVAFVRLAGSLDAYLRTLGPRVEEAARQSASHVVLDLSEVDFIGSRGMGLLFALHRVLKALERKFIVLSPSVAVRDALSVGGMDSLLEVTSSEDEALALCSGGEDPAA